MEMPLPETYEEGLHYWPYLQTLQTVARIVKNQVPQHGHVLDVMCGTGTLLEMIAAECPDVKLSGMDIDPRYVTFAEDKYKNFVFSQGDVLSWQPRERVDGVLCTGALHHVPYPKQAQAIANIALMVKPGGVIILADAYVDNYTDEIVRQLAAARLGFEYLQYAIRKSAPPHVLEWTIDILRNDVTKQEFKMSLAERLPILQRHLPGVATFKLWPNNEDMMGYGEYVHIYRNN